MMQDSARDSQGLCNFCYSRRVLFAAMAESDRQVLTVTSSRQGDTIRGAVHDTGPGIPPHRRRTLFEPLHASTSAGMGIGLSLCRSIVEAHGGRIRVQPSDNGATLEFQLPMRSQNLDEA